MPGAQSEEMMVEFRIPGGGDGGRRWDSRTLKLAGDLDDYRFKRFPPRRTATIADLGTDSIEISFEWCEGIGCCAAKRG